MKILVGSILLLLAAVVCGQRIRTSRRLPGGRPEAKEFDCPAEFGYYPHPLDCSRYYTCVFGGALLESCTEGLLYNVEQQTCDWPEHVKNCDSSKTIAPSTFQTIKIIDPRTRKATQPIRESTSPAHSNTARVRATTPSSLTNQVSPRYEPAPSDQYEYYYDGDDIAADNRRRSSRYYGSSSQQSSLRVQPTTYKPAYPYQAIRGRQPADQQQPSSNGNYVYYNTSDSSYSGYPAPAAADDEFYYEYEYEDGTPYNPDASTTYAQEPTRASYSSPSTSSGSRNTLRRPQSRGVVVIPREETTTSRDTRRRTVRPSGRQQTAKAASRTVDTSRSYSGSSFAPEKPTARRSQLTADSASSQTWPYSKSSNDRRPVSTQYTYEATPARDTATSSFQESQAAAAVPYQQQPTYDTSLRFSSASRSQASKTSSRNRKLSASGKKSASVAVTRQGKRVVDIYMDPPSRPAPRYQQPQSDVPAHKCNSDSCVLPDCSCGGGTPPGNLRPEEVPQIVLLTFDDSVNDLNKELYEDLFENGRVNPNGCPITATFYVSHEWTNYGQVQSLYAKGHEMASHSITHSDGAGFSVKKWYKEIAGQREVLSAFGGVKMSDVRGMRAPFLAIGGNNMMKMLYEGNFTYDSSMPVYDNNPPSYPYTFDYKISHDCMIPPCPTKSYPGVWEVPMVMWQGLNGGRCSMGDACSTPATAEDVYKMLIKNFQRHYTTNRAPFPMFYHASWFVHAHHKEGFIAFMDTINSMDDVYIITNWQAIQWMRDPTPLSRIKNFEPFGCDYSDRPAECTSPRACNLRYKTGIKYMRTCQPCPPYYPWTGKTGVYNTRASNSVLDN